ncbi:MAG TPA: thioredoxin family protein [Terracidiphilus sp.]|nr:thioredoxin family protein [Terracidiphilus sp.]
MTTARTQIANVVSESEWLGAREKLLDMEKQLTRQRDAVNAARRALPWVRVEKEYVFDTAEGRKTLSDLFAGRSQLIIYSFMWRHDLGNGCIGCSFLCDHVDGANLHLAHHDVSFVAVSRAPLNDLLKYKQRMGWQFEWVSSLGSDFNVDYHVSFRPEELGRGEVYYNYRKMKASLQDLQGQHVFYNSDEGEIFHTYSCYARGNEEVVGAYMWLDLTPKGRNENGPYFSLADWVRPHDRYDQHGATDSMGGYHAETSARPSCCCHETHT